MSPHLKPARRLPKPKEKTKTRMPNALAVIRCPNSCTKMMIAEHDDEREGSGQKAHEIRRFSCSGA